MLSNNTRTIRTDTSHEILILSHTYSQNKQDSENKQIRMNKQDSENKQDSDESEIYRAPKNVRFGNSRNTLEAESGYGVLVDVSIDFGTARQVGL